MAARGRKKNPTNAPKPRGRRRKAYDQQLQEFQNRNVFAAILFLIALVVAVYVFAKTWDRESTIHITVKHVIYGREDSNNLRIIPFAEESCQKVADSFGGNLLQSSLDSNEFGLELPDAEQAYGNPDVGTNDVHLVYFMGHLDSSEDQDDIFVIRPASDADKGTSEGQPRVGIKNWLIQFANTNAKHKVVFLDAGNWSPTPIFPGREQNRFHKSLNQILKEDRWGLGDNFWIVVSHSENEASLTSTPMRCSLFAKAIEDSVNNLCTDGFDAALDVTRVFAQIRDRTRAYSRNFADEILQTPQLYKSGVGLIRDATQFASDDPEVTFLFPFSKADAKADDDSTARGGADADCYLAQF